MAKETRLGDSAEIYQPRDNKTEKEKWLSMDSKQRWQYFNQYYRNKLIISIFCIGFLVYLLYSIFRPKVDTVLYTAIIDGCIDTDMAMNFQTDMTNRLELDTKKSNVIFDDGYYLNGSGEFTSANQMKLVAQISDHGIDVMILPEEYFSQYASSGYFAKVTDYLPPLLLSTLKDDFVYSAAEEDSKESAYGIALDDYAIKDSTGQSLSKPILCVVSNSKHIDNAINFIQYLNQQ